MAERHVPPNFVTDTIDDDLAHGRVTTVVTRFPPEPNGYLHIGHAKAICLDFGVALDYGGRVHLRFDDTNPTTEDVEFVEAIRRDVRWLGFSWDEERFASDYFQDLFQMACTLIERGDAYVDEGSDTDIREARGTVTQPGTPSPYRDRPASESLDLFRAMCRGDVAEGAAVLRARIDMASPNMIMRDPVLYRVRHAHHYRTGDRWKAYPLYDFAHPLSDAIEGVTHSLCSLEFENNRELYDWLVERLWPQPRPHQYEFARLKLEHTVVSKRVLLELVRGGHVSGWDDPRMPTLAALRRRGVRPEAIRAFAQRVGVTRAASRTDMSLFESTVRDDLNAEAPRVMAVLDPVALDLEPAPNQAPLRSSILDAPLWPHDVPREGTRPLPFGPHLWIERSDVATDPPKGFRRLSPGAVVRLRHGPVVRCTEIVTDVVDGRDVVRRVVATVVGDDVSPRGVVHWVERESAVPAEFRLVDRLFRDAEPDLSVTPLEAAIDPGALTVTRGFVEPHVAGGDPEQRWQFERQGYFWRDPVDTSGAAPSFVRIVSLKDGWSATTPPHAHAARPSPTKDVRASATSPTTSGVGAEASERDDDPCARCTDAQRSRAEAWQSRGVPANDAAKIALDDDLTAAFDGAMDAQPTGSPASLARWIVHELPRARQDRPSQPGLPTPRALASIVAMVDGGTISQAVGRDLLRDAVDRDGDPRAWVDERGLARIEDDGVVRDLVAAVLADHTAEVAAYRGGKTGLIGFFVGQAMRRGRGRVDARTLRAALEETLGPVERPGS